MPGSPCLHGFNGYVLEDGGHVCTCTRVSFMFELASFPGSPCALTKNRKERGELAYTQLSPLYPSLYPYVTHVINYPRPSPTFPYCKNEAMFEPQLVNYSGLIDYQPYFCISSLTKLRTQNMGQRLARRKALTPGTHLEQHTLCRWADKTHLILF